MEEFGCDTVVILSWNGGDMARPLLTAHKMIRKTITVNPIEWEQYQQLMRGTDRSASARIRAFIRAELKRANERAQA